MNWEYAFLLNCTRQYYDNGIQPIETIDFDWGYFWDLCVFHKVVGIVFGNLKHCNLQIPDLIQEKVNNWQQETQKRNRLQQSEFIKVMRHMDNPVLVMKGFWLTHFLYKSDFIRRSADIDILFDIEDKDELKKVLEQFGYIQSDYDYQNNRIIKASREKVIYQEMFTHELYQYIKMVEDVPVCFDCNFKFSWQGVKDFAVPDLTFDIALSNSCEHKINDFTYKSFNKELFFIHLCVHCYNEYHYFLFDNMVNYNELRLYRLCDLRTMVQQEHLDYRLVEMLKDQVGARKHLDFCINLSNAIFKDRLFDDLNCSLYSDDDLNIYYDSNGKKHHWNLSLEERIYELEKRREETNAIFHHYFNMLEK